MISPLHVCCTVRSPWNTSSIQASIGPCLYHWLLFSSCIPVPWTYLSLRSAFTLNMCICDDQDDSDNLDSIHHHGSRRFEWITSYNSDRVLFHPDSDNDNMYRATTLCKTTTLVQKFHRFWWFDDHHRYRKCYGLSGLLLSSASSGPRSNNTLLQSIAVGLCISGLVYGERALAASWAFGSGD